MEGQVAISRGDVRRFVIACLVHAFLAGAVFVTGRGVRLLFTQGMVGAFARFLEGGGHTLGRMSPILERIEGLLENPDDLGFLLLTHPDARVFADAGTVAPLPDDPDGPPGPRPPTRPATAPPTGPVGPGDDPCTAVKSMGPDAVLAGLGELLGRAAGPDPALDRAMACHLAVLETLAPDRLAKLLEALAGKPPEVSGPLATRLLISGPVRRSTLLDEAQSRDIGTRHPPEVIARQIAEHGVHTLRKMTSLTGSTGPTPTATGPVVDPALPTAPATEPQHPATHFTDLFQRHHQLEICLLIQERLARDWQRYRRARPGSETSLDLAEMKELGMIAEIPYCPNGGNYLPSGKEGVACGVHGNAAEPWKEEAAYKRFFLAWEQATEAIAGGRYQEAIFKLKPLLDRQPSHGYALEATGEAWLAQEKYVEASNSFYKLVHDIWPEDPWNLFQAGLSFYGAGNAPLAGEFLQRLVNRTTYASVRRRIGSHLEYYRFREKAAWILDGFLFPKDEAGHELPTVRFFEFRVAKEPTWVADRCRAELVATKQAIDDFVGNYYSTPVLKRLQQELRELKEKEAELKPFEAEARETTAARIKDVEGKIARFRETEGFQSSGSLVRDLTKKLREEPRPAHEGAIYRIDKRMVLQCMAHPEMLEDDALTGALKLGDEDRARVENALTVGLLAGNAAMRACFDRQGVIWAGLEPQAPDPWAAEAVAKRLNLESPEHAECPSAKKGLGYRTRADGVPGLECRTHGCRALALPQGGTK